MESQGLLHVWHSAWDWYNFDSSTKKYHNFSHASNVVDAVFEIVELPSVALLLAALWHDAVYVPGAGSDSNERCSAAALNVAFNKAKKHYPVSDTVENQSTIMESMQMIMGTSISTHLYHKVIGQGITSSPTDKELAVLLDADLSGLAVDYPEFEKRQHNIILENFGEVAKHSKISAEFLNRLANARNFIYHTDKGRELWEEKARNNISKYSHSKGVSV